MCFIKPLKIKKIKDRKVILENGIVAYYDKKIGQLKRGEKVIVYGNLILNKIYEKNR